jgi:hypothetical protein
VNVHPCFVTSSAELRTGHLEVATGHLEVAIGHLEVTAVQPAEPPLAITSAAAAAANVPRSAPYPPARWQVAAAAVLLLRPCRSATGGNSRSTVRAHQQPVQRPAMSPPASRACAALLHIALLCRADRFSPSTLSVTMRRVLCAVCPMLRHRQCGCIALRVQFATAYRKRRGGSKRRQTSTSFWRGLYFTVQNAVPALLCGCARAQHE